MIPFWLLVLCWSHSVLTQPLDVNQYDALMNVYDGLGSFACCQVSLHANLCFFFLCRLRRPPMPTICCVDELY